MDDKNAITKITRNLLLKSKLNNNGSKQTQVFVIPPELLKGLIPENKKIKADISTKILLDNAKTNDTPKIRKSIVSKNKNNEDDSETQKEDFSLKDHSNSKTDTNVNEISKIDSTFEKHESGELDINKVSDGNVLKDSDYLIKTKSDENNAITEVSNSNDSGKDNQDHKEKEFVRYSKVRKKLDSHQKQENQTKQLHTDSDIKTYNEVLTSSSVQHAQISFHVIEEPDKETSNDFLCLKDTEPNSQINSYKILSNNEKLATDNIKKNVEEELLISRKEMNPNTDISHDNQLSSILSKKQQQEHKVYNKVSATDTTDNKKNILKDNKVLSSHSEKQQQELEVFDEVLATDTTDNKRDIFKDNKDSYNHSEKQQQVYEVFDEVLATDTTDNKKDISKDNTVSSNQPEEPQQAHKVFNKVSATDTTDNKKDISKDNTVSSNHQEEPQAEHKVFNKVSETDTTDDKEGISKANKVSLNHSEKQQQEHEVFDEGSATHTTDDKKGISKDKVSSIHTEKQQQEHKVFDEVSATDPSDDKKDNNVSSNYSEKRQQEQVYNAVSATDITDNKNDNKSVKFSSEEINQDHYFNEMNDDCSEMEVTEVVEYIIEEILEIDEPVESQEMSMEMYTGNQNDYENRSKSQKNACLDSKSYVYEESYSDDIALIDKKWTKPINVYVNKKKLNNQRKNDNLSTRFCMENSITLPHNVIIDNSLTEKSNSKLKSDNISSSEISALTYKGTAIEKEATFTEQNKKKLLKTRNQRKSINNFNLNKVETVKTRLRNDSISLNPDQPIKLKDLSYLKTIHDNSLILKNEVRCKSNVMNENIKSFIGNKINEQTCNDLGTTIFKGNHVLAPAKFNDRSFENINLTDVIDNNLCLKNKDERSTENDQIFENQPGSYGFYEDSSLFMVSEKSEEKNSEFAGLETILDIGRITETNQIIENRKSSTITKNDKTLKNQQQSCDFYKNNCLSMGSKICEEKNNHFAVSETINTERITETTIDKEHIIETNKIDEDKEDSNITKNDETFEDEEHSYGFYDNNDSLSMGSETSEEKNNDFADSEIIVNTDRATTTTIETEHIIETNKSEDRVESDITKTDEIFEDQQQSYDFYKDNSLFMKSDKFVETDKVKDVQKDDKKMSSSLIKIKSNEKITREEVQNIFDKFKRNVSKDTYLKSDSKLNTCNENNTGEKICSDNGELKLETQVVTKLNTNMSNNQMLGQIVLQNIHPTISYCTKEKPLKKSETILNNESQSFKNRRKSTTDLIHKKTESPRTRTESLNLDDEKCKTLLKYYHLNAQQLNNNANFEVKKISNSPSNKILSSQHTMKKEDNKPRSTSNKIIDNLQYDDKREDQEFEYLKIRNNDNDSLLKGNEFNNVTVQQNSNTLTKLTVKSTSDENIDVSQGTKKESKDENVSLLNVINLETSQSRRRGRPPKLSKTVTIKNQSIKEDNNENEILEKLLRAGPSQANNAYKEEAKIDHLVAVNVQKRKRGRPPKGNKRNNNSNMEVKDSVMSQEEEKQTANIESIQESLSKTEIDTSEITNHLHEDMTKDIREASSVIIKRKGRRSKSKESNTIFSANTSTTEITTDESIKNSAVAENIDCSIAHNNENLGLEDSHTLPKKRRGRQRSLKKLIPDLLSTEKQNQIEKPDNEKESMDLNNTNNLLDSDTSHKTIEINSPLNCKNSEMVYDECSKSSKDFQTNLSIKDEVDSTVACNNENLSHEDLHTLPKKRRGRPRSLKKLIPDLLSTENQNQIEKPNNQDESLNLNNTNILLDSDNSHKTVEVNSPLNCKNSEMAYDECSKPSKDFQSNLSTKDEVDSTVACNNENLNHEDIHKVHKNRRGRQPILKKEKSVLLRTEKQGHTEEPDNKKESLNMNSTNNLLSSDDLEITTNETDESSKTLHYNKHEEGKIDYGIAHSSESINYEEPQGIHKKRRGRPPSVKKLKPTLLNTDKQPIDNPVTDNNEEPLRLNSPNNALNSDNLEMTIDETDKSNRDLYNNASISEQIDYSIAYNNENLSYDDTNSSNNRRKTRSSSLEKSCPVLLSEKQQSPMEKSDNKEESFDFNNTSNLLNSDHIELAVDKADKSDLDTEHNRGKSRSLSSEHLCPASLNTEKQSPIEKLDNEGGPLNLNSVNNLLNSDNFEKITDDCNKSSNNVHNNLTTEDKIDSNTACNNEMLSHEDLRNTRKKRRGRPPSLRKSNRILLSLEKQNPIEKPDKKEESLDFNSTSKLFNSNNKEMAVDESGNSDKALRDNTPGESTISSDFRTTCNDVNTTYKEPQGIHKKRRGRPPSAKKLKRSLLSTDRHPVDNPDNKKEFLDFNSTNNLLNSDKIELAADEAGKSDLDTEHNRGKSRSPSSENLCSVLLNTEQQSPIEKLDNEGGPLNLNSVNNLLNSDNFEKITDECNKSSKNVCNNLPSEDEIGSNNTTCNNETLSNEDSRRIRKKRKGRPPSLRKSNRVLLSPEKQSSIENSDNKVESLELNISTKRRGRRSLKPEVSNFNPPCEKLENVTTEQNVKSSSVSLNKDNLEYEVATTKNDSHEKTSFLECEPPKRRTRRSKLIDYSSDSKLNENATSNDMDINVSTPVSLRKRKRNLDTEKELSDEDESNNDDEENVPTKTRSRKRKCDFSIYRERKRGRPKGTQNKVKICDDDYVPHHSQIPRSPKKANAKSNTSGERTTKKIISCGKCKKEMMRSQWPHHNLSTHNDLGWIEGTPKPDYENDERLLRRLLFITIKKRKGSLICETCNSLKRSVLGFLSHITFCGKDDEEKQALMVTCPVCKAVTKPSSLEYHERLHKAQAEEKEKLALLEVEDSGLKTKRKAAEKAVTKISEFTALVKEDKIIVPADKKSKPDIVLIKKLIQKPKLTKRIPNTVINKWKKVLDIGNKPMCSQVGCHFVCESLDEIKLHYSTCNFTPQEKFVCKICHFNSSSEDEILNHAIQKHSAEDDVDVNLSMSDIESSNSDNNSDLENTNDKNKGGLIKRFFFRERSEYAHKMFRFLFRDGACHTKYNRTFSPAFQWTLEFEHKNYKFDLFKEYIPNTFELLSAQESKMYLPELDQSMMMKTIKVGYRDSPESVWRKWKRFEGQCVLENPTFFVGGPVWALAWLPIPSTLSFSENVSQFIAISTHSTMDAQFSAGSVYSGKNIIQIWNLGDLNHKVGAKNSPALAYAIAHDGGTAWCLEWCPSGCYQSDDVLPKESKGDNSKRMGLLAAACSDGCVRVYSLVFPKDLPSSRENYKIDEDCNTTYPIYKTEPALLLVVNRKMYENKQQTWQVTKLSWTKENNHNVIVAGFSNGYVALWDLSTKSPLLKSKKGNTVFLNPYRHFLAHHHVVTMVYIIPQDKKRFLATASLDRYYKFWDLEDTINPRNISKKSYVTDGTFLNHWCSALITYDDALSMNHNYTYCLPLREYTYKYYNILPTNSTSYTIDASDFGNSIANGTLAGEILAMFPQQLIYIRDMDKTLPRKRYISMVSSLEVVDFNTTSKDGKLLKTDKDELKNEKIFMPSTYSESKDRFGIKFLDKMNSFREDNFTANPKGCRKTLTCDMMQGVPIEQYPFMSANRVSWNPNAWSFLWLAAGYQNGFVRLTSFKSLASTAEWNKLLTSHIDTLKSENSTITS